MEWRQTGGPRRLRAVARERYRCFMKQRLLITGVCVIRNMTGTQRNRHRRGKVSAPLARRPSLVPC